MIETTIEPFADDVELSAGLRAADASAYEVLVRRYGPRMFTVARRFFRSEEDCADAVQDAFLSAFRALERFEGSASLGTWLHRIVVNACLMKLRARGRRRQLIFDDPLPDADQLDRSALRAGRQEESVLVHLTRAETQAQVRS